MSKIKVKIPVVDIDVDEITRVIWEMIKKELMYKKSDAFIVLPGGIGTIDEVFEVIATNILIKSNKLLILLNYNKFWNSLINLLNKNIKQKYSKKEIKNNIKVTTSINEIFIVLNKE